MREYLSKSLRKDRILYALNVSVDDEPKNGILLDIPKHEGNAFLGVMLEISKITDGTKVVLNSVCPRDFIDYCGNNGWLENGNEHNLKYYLGVVTDIPSQELENIAVYFSSRMIKNIVKF